MLNERDTEILIDNQLRNLGWENEPQSANRNVYQQRVKTQEQRQKLQGLKPDYVLYPSNSSVPLAVIEAKRKGRNIHNALCQGTEYAKLLGAPLVFATDGVFTKTIHVRVRKPLILNGEELDELIREALAIKYIGTNEVQTLGLGRDSAADGRTAPAGLRHPSHRTGRATFTASGSPSDGLDQGREHRLFRHLRRVHTSLLRRSSLRSTLI